MIQTLSNPVFWQGFAAALALATVGVAVFLVLIGGANDDIPLDRSRRANDRHPWGGPSANDDTRTRRSELRGGPR